MKIRNLTSWLTSAILILVILFLFESCDFQQTWVKLIFPKPLGIVKDMSAVFMSPNSPFLDILISLNRIILGLVLGTALAVPLGIIVGVFGKKLVIVKYLVDFMRSIPQIALFPIFALLFGIENTGKIMMAAVGCFLMVFVSAVDGILIVNQERLDSMKWMNATRWQMIKYLLLPQSLPTIAVGIRIAASVSIIIVLISEMLYGTLDGIGYRLYLSQMSYRVNEMWGYIIIIGIIGVLINNSIVFIQNRVIHWTK